MEGAGSRTIIIIITTLKKKKPNQPAPRLEKVLKKIRTSEIKRCREHDSLSVEV